MEVIGRHCKKDSTSLASPPEAYVERLLTPPSRITIGVPWNFLEGLDKEVAQGFENSLQLLRELGYSVIDIDLDILKYSIAVYHVLATAEASTNLARFDGVRFGNRSSKAKTVDEVFNFSRQEGFGSEVKRRIMLGTYVLSAGYQEAYYRKAQRVRAVILNRFKKAFVECQVIVTPTSPCPAFELGSVPDPLKMSLQDIYTIPANLAGLPAISIPSGFSSKGLPLGLHMAAPLMEDGMLLQIAHHFEEKTLFTQKIPLQFDEKGKKQ